MDTVDKEVDSCEATGQKGSPPPVIVLSTKMKVAQQDGGFWTSDDKNDKHQKQETEHVVGLVRPNTV